MTNKQRFFYLDLARRAYSGPAAGLNEWRQEQRALAIGCRKKFAEMTNAEFDLVIEHFQELIDPTRFSPTGAADRQKRRLLTVVGKYQELLGEHYVAAILSARFGCAYPDELELEDLKQLLSTLANRAKAKGKSLEANHGNN